MISQIIKITPILSAFIIGCGYLRWQLYYRTFKIHIEDFTSISEILMMSLQMTVMTVFILIFSIISHFLRKDLQKSTDDKLKTLETPKQTKVERIISLVIEFIRKYYVQVYGVIIIPLISFGYYFLKTNKSHFIENSFWFIGIPLILLYSLVINKVSEKNPKFYDEYSFILAMSFIYGFFQFTASFEDIRKVKNHEGVNVEFIYNLNDTVKSDKNLLYLGQTKDYLFMYDNKRQEAEIYSMHSIGRIVIK